MDNFIWLGVFILIIVSFWKVFEKAGHPGWASIIPIYNTYILIKVAQQPWWWLILMFIPLVNIVFALLLSLEVAKKFGRGTGFGVGLFFLPIVFYPILAFGDDRYISEETSQSVSEDSVPKENTPPSMGN